MDAFTQLQSDIADLIATASDTIDKLVQDAANKAVIAAAPVADSASPVTADHFTQAIVQLSSDVRQATEKFKAQAATILGVPATTAPVTTPTPPTDANAPVNAPPATPEAPAAAPAETPTSAALAPVDFSAPAGPVTIGPNSFRSGA